MLNRKLYKNISVVALGAALISLPLFTACESDVVDLSPVDKFSDLTAYGTPARCELSMIGAYDAAQCGMYINSDNGWQRGYPFGAASIQQGEMRGEDMNLTAVFYDYTYSATYNLSTANNVAMWETSFEAINRYNTVYAGQEYAGSNGILDEATANQYKGECLFLRALTYHNLMVHYALPYNVDGNNNYGMPLYITAINTPEAIQEALLIGRSTVAETYAQILKDLDDAERLLPDVVTAGKISRASKGAAIALKTRVYLHMRNWAKVIEEAEKLEGGRFQLEADPATPFTSKADNKESVFSIENSTEDNPDVNGSLGQMMSGRDGGRAIITSSPTVYNSKYWTKDDKRRNLLLYRESDKYYFCDKYQDPTSQDAWAPILRYSEVLLNEAEAAARSNNKTLALEKLNEVRDRSLANPAQESYKASDFADTKALLEAILWERRIEFHGEGRRWEDIHRLANDDLFPSGGIPAKIEYNNSKGVGAFVVNGEVKSEWYSSSKKFIPYTDKRFIWPIPLNDILRNPTLAKQQNAGWE
ncbi:RagB/SusD family nutrient uptake outer membrane protein [Parabacteroides timonensis]|uniref:RagB/SusD family nutrient uptake outer membrane protein n=1 Tax=Parabacteroides timonensis TaxID=1871013 RepID=UPI00094E9BF7|nr:RagB/SusD family nutrient uptake outer membrane protein [Parabacteroides timonensis]